MTRPILAALLLAVAVTACESAPAPRSTTTLDPIGLPAPLHEARTIPQPDGSIRIESDSGRAVPDQPYVYAAFTHCGFTANTFDFDGSFWAIVDAPAAFAAQNGNPPAGIDNPTDNGVILLTSPDRATWTSRAGARLALARAGAEVQVFGCD